jgi:hypothetical protein
MTDIESLRLELKKITSYPPIFKEINCGVSGVGFFPGARGLWRDEDECLSDKPVMILGHDFGAEKDYDLSVKRGEENLKALTWKNLYEMLSDFKIETNECFFTNAIMGVRTEGSAVGKSPAFKYPEYLNDCKSFLVRQIDIQRPKVIIVLGLHLLGFISDMSLELLQVSKIKTYKKLDQNNLSGFMDIAFDGLDNYRTNIVFITHPTYRHLNVENRKYNNLIGIEAESKLFNQYYQR